MDGMQWLGLLLGIMGSVLAWVCMEQRTWKA